MFDLHQVPFSRHRSYMGISYIRQNDGFYLRHLRGGIASDRSRLFRIDLLQEGQLVDFTPQASPDVLRLEAESGWVEFCLTTIDVMRVRGQGVTLRLSLETEGQFDNGHLLADGRHEIVFYRAEYKLGLLALSGDVTVDTPWDGSRKSEYLSVTCSGTFDAILQGYASVWPKRDYAVSFDDARAAVHQEYENWLATTLPVPEHYEPARELAAYINWSCVVGPERNFTRPAMLMSKNWMNKIWSWDNCFNALALAQQDPALAWDQLMIFFDHQDAFGALADHLTDSTISFRFYKPPIHGWTLRELMKRADFITDDHLHEIYEPLCAWTDWWLTYRDDDGDGMPQYNHGNESGWDNGTVFGAGVPVESPDLAAYLVIQMDVLADIAHRLNHRDEAAVWRTRADKLLARLIDHSWDGEQFVAHLNHTHEVPPGDSSLVFMPLLLGDRLPANIREKMVAGLRRFMTGNGIASEHPDSPLYIPDGYWRGPVWAPSTYLLVAGLIACGEMDMAREVSVQFCDMCLRSGMAENYDALTGDGLRDRAYTWTSSVFLMLANML